MRQKSFFLRKIVKRDDALAVVVLIARTAAKPREIRINLRGLNRADQAGESVNEIAHITFHVAQMIIPNAAFGEMLQGIQHKRFRSLHRAGRAGRGR